MITVCAYGSSGAGRGRAAGHGDLHPRLSTVLHATIMAVSGGSEID